MSNLRIVVERVPGDLVAAMEWVNRYAVAAHVKQFLPTPTYTQVVMVVTTDHWVWVRFQDGSDLPVKHNRRSTDK